jgi:predicted transcriptional regulator of viral defense system
MKKSPKSIAEYVDDLQQKGRYTFTKAEARRAVRVSDTVLKLSLWRLAKKRRIALIREGFYVIVPLEYASSGILPPEWFIDELMKFLRQPYYVGLLSAAAIHGAAHQQPQEFHVVIPEALRSIKEHLPENLEIRWNELVEVAGRRQTRHCVAN